MSPPCRPGQTPISETTMINRRTAKRQIAAARTLLQLIRSHDITIPNARACDQLVDAVDRLHSTTDALGRETYQPQFNPNPQE